MEQQGAHLIGQTISHYRITSKLGQGGMGVVYEAEDLKLQRTVALKFLPSHFGSAEERVRFVREARAAAALDHPNICTIHQIDEHGDSAFIVMARVRGRTLQQELQDGPLSIAKALDVAIQVADGLRAAHAKDIVHRDIKPANLMVDDDGRAQIMDFGLAKLLDATAMTRSAATMGTVFYMAPEQARGRDVDQRADLWSLGVVLFEMLSCRWPFEADHPTAVIQRILEDEAPRLSDVCEGAPAALDAIIDQCLRKDPTKRYQNADELLHDLRAVRQSLAEGADEKLKVRAKLRRRPSRTGPLVVATLIAVAVMLGVVYWISQRTPTEPLTISSPSELWEEIPNVVITRFENRTGDERLDHLSDLSSDLIGTGLGATELVNVEPIAAEDRSREVALADLLQATGADIAVTGSFYLEGDRLSFQARVIDARSAELVFAVPIVEGPKDAPREAIELVAQRVVGGLALRLDNPLDMLVQSTPPTYEAFQTYRRGLDFFLESKPAAMPQFLQAAAMDSLFTRPRVLAPLVLVANPFLKFGYARADTMLMGLSEDPDLDEYERLFVAMMEDIVQSRNTAARTKALRLSSLAPEDRLVRALTMIRQSQDGESLDAIATYNSMGMSEEEQRLPAFAGLTRIIGGAYHGLGRYEEELETRRRLVAYYPDVILFHLDLLAPFAALGHTDSMRVLVSRMLARPGSRGQIDFQVAGSSDELRFHQNDETAREFVDWYLERRPPTPAGDAPPILANNYGTLLYAAERWEEARTVFETNLSEEDFGPPNKGNARIGLSLLAAREGDRSFVEEVIEQEWNPDDFPYDRGTPYLWRARYAALLGDKDEAVRMLQRALANGGGLPHGMEREIDFRALSGYPPFEEVLKAKRS